MRLHFGAHLGDGALTFVQELNCGDNIVILALGVGSSQISDCFNRVLHVIPLLPLDRATLAGIIESVLRAWSSMKINPDFQTDATSPIDGVVEVL